MIQSVRATTREVRTMDRSLRGASTQRTATARNTSAAATTRSTTSAAAPAAPAAPFQSSLWDAFRGSPAPAPAQAPAATTAATAVNTSAAATNSSAGARGGSAVPTSPRSGLTAASVQPRATTQNATATTANETPDPAAGQPPDLITQLRTALSAAGLNPDQHNPRIGSLTISYPNIPTYEYPVVYADINGQATPFYLRGVEQNPSMFAVNVASAMGRPLLNLV